MASATVNMAKAHLIGDSLKLGWRNMKKAKKIWAKMASSAGVIIGNVKRHQLAQWRRSIVAAASAQQWRRRGCQWRDNQ
jgi:hypothetical protein